MNSILDKEPVKRAEKILKEFDTNLNVTILEKTARTANDAATALGCKVGAIVKSLLFKNVDSYFNNNEFIQNQINKSQEIIKNFKTNKSSEIAALVLTNSL